MSSSAQAISVPAENNALPLDEIYSAIACYPEGICQRAWPTLQAYLQPRIDSRRTVEWNSSKLTGSGLPFELTFKVNDTQLRCTLEPGTSRMPAQQRVALATNSVQPEPGLSPRTLNVLSGVARNLSNLNYGAWIGLRFNGQSAQRKLYFELGKDADDTMKHWLTSEFIPWPRVIDNVVSSRMIGFVPTTNDVEIYYRMRAVHIRHLPFLFSDLEVTDAALLKNIRNRLEAAYGYSIRTLLPGSAQGLSYAFNSDTNEIRAITLYFIARSFWGSDSSIRRKFIATAQRHNWDTSVYEAVTQNLANRTDVKTQHGMLGLTLHANGMLSWGIGVRPYGIVASG